MKFLRAKNFILRNSQITSDSTFIIKDEQESVIFHQLQRVLRIKTGDQVRFIEAAPFIGQSELKENSILCELINISKKELVFSILEKFQKNTNVKGYHLAIGLPNNPDKLALLIQKSVELGALSICLIKTANSAYKHQLNLPRLENIVIEAVEQSERNLIPKIEYFTDLERVLNEKKQTNQKVFVALERTSNSKSILDLTIDHNANLLIGPEGGFSDLEIELIRNNKAEIFTLGNSILRMETAAIVACGIFNLKIN